MSAQGLAQGLMQSEAKTKTKKEALAVKSWITDGPWALKVVCFLGCLASLVVSVLACLGSLLDLAALAASAYTAVLSLLGMLLEVKPILCTRGCKRRIEFWFKAAGRVWGRALLYVLIGCLLLSLDGLLSLLVGCAMLGCAFFSLVVSRAASAKLNALHASLTKGYGNKDENRIRAVFQEYDRDGDGSLDSSELALVSRGLGSELSNDELRAVFDVLDQDGSGRVDFVEFRAWWSGDASVDYSDV
jgi:Zn-dependent protease with chaperone function